MSRPVTAADCVHCGVTNFTDRKFCAGCGVALWEPCLECGTENLSGERFCGACGVNLMELVAQEQVRLEQQEMLGRSHMMAHRYHEAMSALSRAFNKTHPRLLDSQQRIKAMIADIRRELTTHELGREKTLAEARDRIGKYDYEGAVGLLLGIPAVMRTEEASALLSTAEEKRNEIAALGAAIREGMAAKKFEGLLAKADRYLELQPHHGPVRTLREKLRQLEQGENERRRDSLMESATKKLNGFQYAEALQLLEQVAPETVTPPIEKMLEFARETAWLERTVREAAALDEHLLPFARRLQKIRPEDPKVNAWIEELERPTEARAGGLIEAIRARQSRPSVSKLLGCQVTALRGFQRIELSSATAASPVYREHIGGWGVACGLALQLLGQGAIKVNLKPAEKNLVRKLFTTPLRRKPAAIVWGLDFGRASLKAVRLSWDPAENKAIVEAVDHVEYEALLGSPEASPEVLLKGALQTFVSRNNLKDIPLAVGIDGRELFTRFFKTPPLTPDRLDDLVQYEAKNQIPYDLSQFSWGFTTLGRTPPVPGEYAEFPIALFAVKLAQVNLRLKLFQDLKLPVELVQSDAAALHNFLTFDRLEKMDCADNDLFLTLDIGAESTNFLISQPGFFWLRNISVGGADFTRALVREGKLTFGQAESQKRSPAAAPRIQRMFSALEPVGDQLVGQIQHSLRAFQNLHTGAKLRHAFVHGDAQRMVGLLNRLQRPA